MRSRVTVSNIADRMRVKCLIYSIYSDIIVKFTNSSILLLVSYLLHYLHENGKVSSLLFHDDKVTVYLDE